MKALRLAINLIRIPRLFLSLLFFPLIVGTVIVYLQLFVTSVVLQATHGTSNSAEGKFKELKEQNFGRIILYGTGAPLPEVTVCRWRQVVVDSVNYDLPPSEDCQPDILDVALRVNDPASFDVSEYRSMFNGNVERIHLGKYWKDKPHLIIDLTGEKPVTNIFSVQGWIVLSLVKYNDEIYGKYITAFKDFDSMMGKLGKMFLHLPGITEPVHLGKLGGATAIIFNILGLTVVALWLALRAHRKVLDYFARNGALLPMVAATGKGTFYLAIWLLTLFRVGAFLGAAVPLMIVTLGAIIDDEILTFFFAGNITTLVLWFVAITAGLGLATIVGSIAELKHRHGLLSFMYRWVPLVVCSIGALVWGLSFLLTGESSVYFREVMTALPVVGITPIIVAPVLKPALWTLLVHVASTILLVVLALRSNARWFAAHLEDL
jgi:hypothetical protein